NIQTIAKFVENSAVLNAATTIGVDFVQGYRIHPIEPLITENSWQDPRHYATPAVAKMSA
ncbi:MAG: hypothetical protein AAFQ63_15995, partial [Cyanobacteria bacterium J06621_11]